MYSKLEKGGEVWEVLPEEVLSTSEKARAYCLRGRRKKIQKQQNQKGSKKSNCQLIERQKLPIKQLALAQGMTLFVSDARKSYL